MEKLSEQERVTILESIKNIHTFKLMLAGGFEKLARKTRDQRAKELLKTISHGEAEDTALWQRVMQEMNASQKSKSPQASLMNLRVGLMMSILGSRGYFEWVLIAEDESVEELALLAENIRDESTSERLVRLAADERLHVERMKKEILGMEAWEMGGSGGVRDVIFGANDGLVSILALVAGVFGAVEESQLVLIAGVAGAIAGTISMGAGAYVSAKSEQEVTQKENQRKGLQAKGSPEEEREALIQFYQAKGFERQSAESIVDRVNVRVEASAEFTLGEQLGLIFEEDWPPSKAGLLTGLSFLVASLVPILPFTFLNVNPAAITAVFASVFSLFAIGASKAIFTRQSWLRSGLEVMAIGTLAAAATYLIGLVIPL